MARSSSSALHVVTSVLLAAALMSSAAARDAPKAADIVANQDFQAALGKAWGESFVGNNLYQVRGGWVYADSNNPDQLFVQLASPQGSAQPALIPQSDDPHSKIFLLAAQTLVQVWTYNLIIQRKRVCQQKKVGITRWWQTSTLTHILQHQVKHKGHSLSRLAERTREVFQEYWFHVQVYSTTVLTAVLRWMVLLVTLKLPLPTRNTMDRKKRDSATTHSIPKAAASHKKPCPSFLSMVWSLCCSV